MKRNPLAIAACSMVLSLGAAAYAQSGSTTSGTKTDTTGGVVSADSAQGKGKAAKTNPEGCDPTAKQGSAAYCAPEASGTTGTSGSTTGTSGTTSGSSTGAGAVDSGASMQGQPSGTNSGATGAGSTSGTGTTGSGTGAGTTTTP